LLSGNAKKSFFSTVEKLNVRVFPACQSALVEARAVAYPQ
jgi:hypothetical protein